MKNNIIFKALSIAFMFGFIAMIAINSEQTNEIKTLEQRIDTLTEETSTLQDNIDIRDEEIEILKDLVDSDFDMYADYEKLESLRKEK